MKRKRVLIALLAFTLAVASLFAFTATMGQSQRELAASGELTSPQDRIVHSSSAESAAASIATTTNAAQATTEPLGLRGDLKAWETTGKSQDEPAMTTEERPLVQEVDEHERTLHKHPQELQEYLDSHPNPNSQEIEAYVKMLGGPNPTFASVADAESQMGVAIPTPKTLPMGVRLASVEQGADGFLLVYERGDDGMMLVGPVPGIHPDGVFVKGGASTKEVTLTNGGRAVMIQGGWTESGWDSAIQIEVVVETNDGKYYIINAMPANAWTMDDLMVILDSLD